MSPEVRGGDPLKVAIIHYWMLKMRGGEKVLQSLCEMYPQADIFTHVYSPKDMSAEIRKHTVRETFIGRLPMAKKLYKSYLPLMPMALEQLDMSEYDLIISSESGPAKGVIARPDAVHVCYCHSPMRYLWDQYPQYRRTAGAFKKLVMPFLMGGLRQWDVTSAARVDHFVANSNAVAARINKYWRRPSEVIAPPVDVERFSAREPREDFFLFVGELVPYKRADLAIRACTLMSRRLIVIGDGPEMASLRRIAGPTIEFLGRVPFDILAEHYARCRAFLFPAEEDFGIVPVEAMASGAPVIAFARGGSRDFVVPDRTGLFFHKQTVSDMVSAITRFEACQHIFDPLKIAEHASGFHGDFFKLRMRAVIDRLLAGDDKGQVLNSEPQDRGPGTPAPPGTVGRRDDSPFSAIQAAG
ncbi:MAG: glycosyltransferase [Alphaproteobacteria bacterium]|nr:glycosyltransferase [Alphaproteobacteria bacterium]